MDKKKLLQASADDLKGFEEFLSQVEDTPPVDKGPKNLGGENLAFLQYDHTRLEKVAKLLAQRVPVLRDYPQGDALIPLQREANAQLRAQLAALLLPEGSPLHKSMGGLFDGFFGQVKSRG